MNNDKTLYEILGFSKNGYNDNGEKVSFESIDRAKNRLLYGEMGSDSVPFWMRDDINKAYNILSNPTSRREYDESLLTHNVSYSSNDTNITEEPVVIEPNEAEQSIVEPQEERTVDETNEEEYDEAVVDLNDYYPSLEATPEEVTSEEVTPEEVTPEEVTPEEVTPEEVTPEEVTPEEVTPEEVTPEEATPKIDIIPLAEKTKKELSKNKKRILFGLSTAFLGIPGMIFAYYKLYKSDGKKLKLHQNKNKKVSEIKTEEARLIEQYNNNLDKEIKLLLAKPNNNYNLQISKARYENQVELLKKRIKLKLSEKVKDKGLLKYKLEYVALNNQLERAENRLREIEQKIEHYQSTGKKKNLLSNALNEKLYEKAEEIKEAENENKTMSIKKLNVRKERLQKARDFSAKTLKLTRNTLGKVQDWRTRTWDSVSSVKEIFTPYDEINGYMPGQETPKTR